MAARTPWPAPLVTLENTTNDPAATALQLLVASGHAPVHHELHREGGEAERRQARRPRLDRLRAGRRALRADRRRPGRRQHRDRWWTWASSAWTTSATDRAAAGQTTSRPAPSLWWSSPTTAGGTPIKRRSRPRAPTVRPTGPPTPPVTGTRSRSRRPGRPPRRTCSATPGTTRSCTMAGARSRATRSCTEPESAADAFALRVEQAARRRRSPGPIAEDLDLDRRPTSASDGGRYA